ncbi:MAG: succinylglutamate desuccinylase, partial [Pseudomonadales bacterium]
MAESKQIIQELVDPPPDTLPDSVEDFLRQLGGPTLLRVTGVDRSRTRAIVTLLHGNEPSGVRAVHQWLRQGNQPAVNIVCCIASVAAALRSPLFTHRMLPGDRDLNRCFRPPFDDEQGRIAEQILRLLHASQPELLVDIHNTSGSGPAFGVVTQENARHEALVWHFSSRMVVTDLKLGSLMEASPSAAPYVTIECGGANDKDSDLVAQHGLHRLLYAQDCLSLPADNISMDVYHQSVRLELLPGSKIAIAEAAVASADITVHPEFERLNFGTVDISTPLAWLGERGADQLRVKDSSGKDVFDEYFRVKDSTLFAAQRLKLFMITTKPEIVVGDCLLYASPEAVHTR